jgi:anti-anti-sigma factor
MSAFTIEEKKHKDYSVMKCSGSIDYSNFNHSDDIVKKAIERGIVKIIFDLAGVNYVSSSGWTVFLGNLRAVRNKGGDIVLANMAPEVKYVFKLLELDNLIDCFETADEAAKRMI